MTRYRTIVADPPWHYEEALPGHTPSTGASHRHAMPYSMMTLDEIAALRLSDLCADEGANLFCWTTNRYLPATFAIIEAWGFSYKQTLTWRKTGNPPPHGGSVAPNHAEFLLVARRGSVGWTDRMASSVIDAPRQIHSKKPELFLDLIEQVSPGPYLEMFARRNRLGWDTWGNEALEHVTLVGVA